MPAIVNLYYREFTARPYLWGFGMVALHVFFQVENFFVALFALKFHLLVLGFNVQGQVSWV